MKTIYNPAYRSMVASLREARRSAGLTQAQVGLELGTSRNWVHKAETCEVRLDALQLARLCDVLGVDARAMIGQLAGGR